MYKIIGLLILCFAPVMTFGASGHGPELLDADVNLADTASLQRGARIFMNYCLSCHSAEYMRYSRMAEDLKLTEDDVKDNLMFTTEKIGETMNVGMRGDDAARWLGAAPPDLSVIARALGANYIFSYLNGFYADDNRPSGVNNIYYPGTSMPHVLSELQGVQSLTVSADDNHGGNSLKLTTPGRMTTNEYRQATTDLVAFLVYVGEPAKLVRYRIGFWVIVFLSILLVATYLMKREYWKDVH